MIDRQLKLKIFLFGLLVIFGTSCRSPSLRPISSIMLASGPEDVVVLPSDSQPRRLIAACGGKLDSDHDLFLIEVDALGNITSRGPMQRLGEQSNEHFMPHGMFLQKDEGRAVALMVCRKPGEAMKTNGHYVTRYRITSEQTLEREADYFDRANPLPSNNDLTEIAPGKFIVCAMNHQLCATILNIDKAVVAEFDTHSDQQSWHRLQSAAPEGAGIARVTDDLILISHARNKKIALMRIVPSQNGATLHLVDQICVPGMPDNLDPDDREKGLYWTTLHTEILPFLSVGRLGKKQSKIAAIRVRNEPGTNPSLIMINSWTIPVHAASCAVPVGNFLVVGQVFRNEVTIFHKPPIDSHYPAR